MCVLNQKPNQNKKKPIHTVFYCFAETIIVILFIIQIYFN